MSGVEVALFAFVVTIGICLGLLWLATERALARVEQERDTLWDELHRVPSTSEGE